MAVYDIQWSALTSAGSGVGAGTVCCPNVANTLYVPATTANIAAVGRVSGVAITTPDANGSFQMQFAGEVPASITGLGAGAVAAVRISATGTLERVVTTPPLVTDRLMGDCDALGSLTIARVSFVNAAPAGGGASPTGAAGGQLGGTYPNPTVTHGTSATTACAGDDARLSNSRAPSGAATGSLGSTYPAPTVVQVDGAAGILPVIATQVNCTGDTKCQPVTYIGHFATANNTIATAFTSGHLTTGTWKVNIAVTADANDNVNGGAWDISFVMKHTGASTAAIVGTAPSSVAPDNGSAGTSAWRATVDVATDTFRLRVTGDAALATDFGYVVQIVPLVQ